MCGALSFASAALVLLLVCRLLRVLSSPSLKYSEEEKKRKEKDPANGSSVTLKNIMDTGGKKKKGRQPIRARKRKRKNKTKQTRKKERKERKTRVPSRFLFAMYRIKKKERENTFHNHSNTSPRCRHHLLTQKRKSSPMSPPLRSLPYNSKTHRNKIVGEGSGGGEDFNITLTKAAAPSGR